MLLLRAGPLPLCVRRSSSEPRPHLAPAGSQYSHLIARRIREANVFCELYSCLVDIETLNKANVVGIILSGGPSSVYEEGSPHVCEGFFEWAKPVFHARAA